MEAVESIGALQAQHWPAVPVALWSRLRGLRMEELHQAFAGGRLVPLPHAATFCVPTEDSARFPVELSETPDGRCRIQAAARS